MAPTPYGHYCGACAQWGTWQQGAQPWKEPAPQNTLFTNLHIEQSTCPKNRLEVIANGVTIQSRHPLFGGRGCIIGGTFPDCLYACDKRRFQPSVVRQHLNFVGPPFRAMVMPSRKKKIELVSASGPIQSTMFHVKKWEDTFYNSKSRQTNPDVMSSPRHPKQFIVPASRIHVLASVHW